MGDEGEAFEGERYTIRRVEGGEGRVEPLPTGQSKALTEAKQLFRIDRRGISKPKQ